MRNINTAPPGRSRRLGAIRRAADDLRLKARLLKGIALDKLAIRTTYERDFTSTYVMRKRRFAILGWKFERVSLVPRRKKRAMSSASLSNLRPRSSNKDRSGRS